MHHAKIEVEGYGTIEVALNANVAPITVSNFCHLVEEGFYDGLTFHRVVPGFMIQGGDPEGNGTGGSDATIKGEFEDNGVENNIPHVRGTISMARASDYDSASSQFFIMQEEADYLDGQYAAFGTVTSGIEVVDAICEGVSIADEASGLVTEQTQPVISSITLVD
nr:peptidylprolyl isomerase [Thermophilibacter sp. ET337]